MDEVTVFIAALSWCIPIYLVIFSLSRLGVRMWALFMGWWYLFPFLGVHGVGFLVMVRVKSITRDELSDPSPAPFKTSVAAPLGCPHNAFLCTPIGLF